MCASHTRKDTFATSPEQFVNRKVDGSGVPERDRTSKHRLPGPAPTELDARFPRTRLYSRRPYHKGDFREAVSHAGRPAVFDFKDDRVTFCAARLQAQQRTPGWDLTISHAVTRGRRETTSSFTAIARALLQLRHLL